MIDRTEDPTKFREQLYEPLMGASPEEVPAEVIEEEINAFRALSAQTIGR